jgi:signal transduction histidine kinase
VTDTFRTDGPAASLKTVLEIPGASPGAPLREQRLVSFGTDLLARVTRILTALRVIGILLMLPMEAVPLPGTVVGVLALAVSAGVMIWWPRLVRHRLLTTCYVVVDLTIAVGVEVHLDPHGVGMVYMSVTLIMFAIMPSWVVWIAEVVAVSAVVGFSIPADLRRTGSDAVLSLVNYTFHMGCIWMGAMVTRLVSRYEAELEAVLEFEREKTRLSERLELANDMHDTVTKSLYGCGAYAEGLSRMLDGECYRAADQARDLVGLIRTAETESRQLMMQLSESVYGEPGLIQDRVLELVAQYPKLEITADVSAWSPGDWRIRMIIIRTLRELLENVSRHARAKKVQVVVRNEDAELVLRVSDNGVGFKPLSPQILRSQGHFGLSGIRERVAAMQGSMQVSSDSGGTTVEIRIPEQEALRSGHADTAR